MDNDPQRWIAQHNFRLHWLVYLETGDPVSCLLALNHLHDAGIIRKEKYLELRLELRESSPVERTRKDPSKTWRDHRICEIITFFKGKPKIPKTPAPNLDGLDQADATQLRRQWLDQVESEGLRPAATVDDVIREVILRDFKGVNFASVRRMYYAYKRKCRQANDQVDPILRALPARTIRLMK